MASFVSLRLYFELKNLPTSFVLNKRLGLIFWPWVFFYGQRNHFCTVKFKFHRLFKNKNYFMNLNVQVYTSTWLTKKKCYFCISIIEEKSKLRWKGHSTRFFLTFKLIACLKKVNLFLCQHNWGKQNKIHFSSIMPTQK